jgi:endoglucanase
MKPIAFKLSVTIIAFMLTAAIKATPVTITEFIKTDQFGYRNNDQKIAIISDPQVGYNEALSFTPGNVYQIRNWYSDSVVFSGSPVAWNGGATHDQSGDKVWWFDFSSFTTPGSYYVYDSANNVGSYRFEINNRVYNNVLKAACRANFYQRCGQEKQLPYAETGWTDPVCHKGANQDLDCRLWSSPNEAGTSKDLSGGWHDAGDYNKYVNYAWDPVLDLLLAYEEYPAVWTDDYGIPESGNGVADILDDAKYELDWLLKMQNSDGSVLSVVGTNNYATASPPSNDLAERFYGPATTAATYATAGMFALASIEFNVIGKTLYADTLRNAAINAWNWALANPGIIFHNNNQNPAIGPVNYLAAGDQENSWSGAVDIKKLVAAVYLFAATGNPVYKTQVDANYSLTNINSIGVNSDGSTAIDALLYYTKTNGATTSIKNTILNAYTSSLKTKANNLPSFTNQTDAYRAYISNWDWSVNKYLSVYDWGNNTLKSHQGTMYLNMIHYNLDPANAVNYYNAASAYIHYFHGVNPNSKTYLSNMAKYGAENSLPTFYHSWFCDGSSLWDEAGVSTYGPAPGFMTMGPNEKYGNYTCCATNCQSICSTVSYLFNQPAQKAYRDFNGSYPFSSWVITECQIYTQAAYIRLLSKFANIPTDCNGDVDGTATLDICGICSGGNTGRIAETNPCNCPDTKLATRIKIKSCGEYTSPSGKYTWTNSGTYRDTVSSVQGCDSLLLIDIDIGASSSASKSVSACEKYISPSGKYSWKVSGIYTDTIPNNSGCDSIIIIDLNIEKNSKNIIYPVACISYTSHDKKKVWTNSGIYSDTIPNSNACDSIITVKLTVKKVDVSLSQSGGTLTAGATSGSFRWFHCDNGKFTLINDALNRNYSPSSPGEYAVELTQNDCVDTSMCILFNATGIDQGSKVEKPMIFPNPATDRIRILLPQAEDRLDVDLKNVLGQVFHKEVFFQTRDIEFSFHVPKGIYFMVLRNSNQQQSVLKLVIK